MICEYVRFCWALRTLGRKKWGSLNSFLRNLFYNSPSPSHERQVIPVVGIILLFRCFKDILFRLRPKREKKHLKVQHTVSFPTKTRNKPMARQYGGIDFRVHLSVWGMAFFISLLCKKNLNDVCVF